MADLTVSLEASALEEVLKELEREFSAQGVPTAGRLRAALLVEELFSALRGAKDGEGTLRCTFPRPGTVVLRYAVQGEALKPDLRMVQRLNRNPCTDGVNAKSYEGRCVITVRTPPIPLLPQG
jgi:hypothetical protein